MKMRLSAGSPPRGSELEVQLTRLERDALRHLRDGESFQFISDTALLKLTDGLAATRLIFKISSEAEASETPSMPGLDTSS